MKEPAIAQPDVKWERPIEIASGPGNRGEWRQNESDWDYVDDPAVALQPNGGAAVAWVDQRRKDVLFQIYGRDGNPRMREPVNVSRNPTMFSWLPRIALAPDRPNDIYILWQEIVFSGGSHGGDIFFARSQDGGATFSEPVNLSSSKGGDGKGRTTAAEWDNGSLDIAVAADGKIYAAWTEYHGPLWFSRSDDLGARFSKPMRVTGDEKQPARAPALAVGPSGSVYLAWTDGENVRADIRVAKADDGRTFSEPTVVAQTSSYSDAPKLAVDERGITHLAFTERSPNWSRAAVHYARSTDGAQSFSAPQQLSTGLAAYPSLRVDARGNLYCSWESYRDERSGGRGLGFSTSRDGGRTFSKPASIPGSSDPDGGVNGSNQGKLMRKLAVGSDGQLAVVNSSLKQGQSSRVWLMRGE
ncbi:MAG TPA: sialidase family protein [Chthoniobacterales bacterium]|nr:sialidase family protein [Chthoniobacterales bacterium]